MKSKLHETFQNKNKKLKSAHTGAAQAIRKTFQNEIISKWHNVFFRKLLFYFLPLFLLPFTEARVALIWSLVTPLVLTGVPEIHGHDWVVCKENDFFLVNDLWKWSKFRRKGRTIPSHFLVFSFGLFYILPILIRFWKEMKKREKELFQMGADQNTKSLDNWKKRWIGKCAFLYVRLSSIFLFFAAIDSVSTCFRFEVCFALCRSNPEKKMGTVKGVITKSFEIQRQDSETVDNHQHFSQHHHVGFWGLYLFRTLLISWWKENVVTCTLIRSTVLEIARESRFRGWSHSRVRRRCILNRSTVLEIVRDSRFRGWSHSRVRRRCN